MLILRSNHYRPPFKTCPKYLFIQNINGLEKIKIRLCSGQLVLKNWNLTVRAEETIEPKSMLHIDLLIILT